MTRSRRDTVALLVAILLIGANLRATITGVGPLLTDIGEDEGLPLAALGALAAIPLLSFAAISPLAHSLAMRFGLSRVVQAALVALALGTVWRSVEGTALNLWCGTILIGAALAIGNVLMPAVMTRDFPGRSTGLAAVFTAVLGGVGALAAGAVVPLSHVVVGDGALGWRGALLLTGILVPAAILAWHLAPRPRPLPAPSTAPAAPIAGAYERGSIWRDRLAWWITAFMGLQSASFYILSTWLAPYARSLGIDEVAAGGLVMTLQVSGIAGSLLVPVLVRTRVGAAVPATVALVALVAVGGLLVAPQAVVAWSIVIGVAAGASLSLSFVLLSTRAKNHETASALSGMVQSIGYLVAATGPVLFGVVRDATGQWAPAFLVLLGMLGAQAIAGLVVGRPDVVLSSRDPCPFPGGRRDRR